MKHSKNNFVKWIARIALIWTMMITMAVVCMAGDASKIYNDIFQIDVSSDQNVEVEVTGNGFQVKLYGQTTSGCGGGDSTVTATITIKNVAVKTDGTTPRGVNFKLTTSGTKADVTEQILSWTSHEDNIQFTATSGSGSSNFSTVTISFPSVDLEALGISVDTTFIPSAGGTYTVDGNAVTSETVLTKKDTESYSLSATAESGYTIYGWASSAGMLDTTGSATYEYVGKQPSNVWPIFRKSATDTSPESAVYSVGAMVYTHLDEAITAADSSGTIVVTQSGATYHSDGETTEFEIPFGVKLLVPYSATDTGLFKGITTSDTSYYFADKDSTTYQKGDNHMLPAYAPKPYVTLTVPSGVTITCETGAAISLSGTKLLHGNTFYGNGQTIAYGDNKVGYIQLDGKIILEKGSNLYCYGYIIGNGTVEAKGGANVHENLELTDYKGGTAASYYKTTSTYNTFPYNQYYAQNVETKLLLHKDAVNTVYLGVYADSAAQIDDFQFVGPEGLFRLTGDNAILLREYTATDRVTYTINGNVSFSSISMNVKQVDVNSGDYVMALTNNMNVYVNSGNLSITEDIALLPDTKVVIASGASMTVESSAKLYIYDKADWRGFAYGTLHTLGRDYSPTRDGIAFSKYSGRRYNVKNNSARLEINGTLNMYGNVFTTRGGVGPIKVGTNAEDTRTVYSDPKTMDKVIWGNGGTINNYADWQTNQAMSQVTMTRANNKSLALYVVFCDPAFAHIGGVDTATTYSTFAAGTADVPATYSSVVVDGVTYWKQQDLTVNGDSSAITMVTGSLDTGIGHGLNYVSDLSVASGKKVLTNNAAGRVINNKALSFTLAEGYKVDAINATLSQAEDGTYTLSNVTGDVTIKVTPLEGCEHEWTEATCTTPKTCSVCGATEGEALGHTPAEAVENEVAATCTTDGSYDTVVYCSVCDAELSRVPTVIPATGHTAGEAVVENEVTATCTADGSYDTVVYCTVCNAELSRVPTTVPATSHTAAEAVVENEVAATCGADGSYDTVVYCSVCNAELSRETTTVPATGHTEGEAVKENVKAPSYNAAGSYDRVVYCSVCKAELSRETVSVPELAGAEASIGNTKYGTLEEALEIGGEVTLLAHIDADKAFEIKNTVVLNLNGFNVSATENDTNGDGVFHVIAGGDLTIEGEGVINGASKGNNYSIAIWADDGKVTINGGTYTNVDAGEDNHYDLIYVKNGGEVVINGGTFIAQTPAWTLNSHDTSKGTITVYGGNFHDFNPCNNKAEGVGTNFCADGYCAVEENGYYTVQKHSYESAVTAPTCTAAGYTTYTCVGCNNSYVDNYVDALGHTEAEAVVENEVAATCGADGSYDNVVYCTVCDAELSRDTVAIPATGAHVYANEVSRIEATCTTDGSVTMACGCGAKETTVLPATDHVWDNACDTECNKCDETRETQHSYDAVVTAPTCTVGGYTTYTCSVCSDSYTTNEIEANGHNYEAVVTEATNTDQGYTTYTCASCGNSYTDNYTIIGHYGFSLVFEDDIAIKVYSYITGESAAKLPNAGIEIWTAEDYNPEELGEPTKVISGMEKNGKYYQIETDGIAAKNMGDKLYFRRYIIVDDVKYMSSIREYSPAIYCKNQINKGKAANATEKQKAQAELCIALMNYGAEAQKYFASRPNSTYKYDELMNSFMTSEEQTWTYDSSMCIATKNLPSYGWSVADTSVVNRYGEAVVTTGALQIKSYITVQSGATVRMLYWTEVTAGTELKIEAASEMSEVGPNGSLYQGSITGIAAKNLGSTIYFCAEATIDGVTYYTAPRAYSVHQYASNQIKNEKDTANMCKTLVMYSNAAKYYFGTNW